MRYYTSQTPRGFCQSCHGEQEAIQEMPSQNRKRLNRKELEFAQLIFDGSSQIDAYIEVFVEEKTA